jgi:hypothetical protein
MLGGSPDHALAVDDSNAEEEAATQRALPRDALADAAQAAADFHEKTDSTYNSTPTSDKEDYVPEISPPNALFSAVADENISAVSRELETALGSTAPEALTTLLRTTNHLEETPLRFAFRLRNAPIMQALISTSNLLTDDSIITHELNAIFHQLATTPELSDFAEQLLSFKSLPHHLITHEILLAAYNSGNFVFTEACIRHHPNTLLACPALLISLTERLFNPEASTQSRPLVSTICAILDSPFVLRILIYDCQSHYQISNQKLLPALEGGAQRIQNLIVLFDFLNQHCEEISKEASTHLTTISEKLTSVLAPYHALFTTLKKAVDAASGRIGTSLKTEILGMLTNGVEPLPPHDIPSALFSAKEIATARTATQIALESAPTYSKKFFMAAGTVLRPASCNAIILLLNRLDLDDLKSVKTTERAFNGLLPPEQQTPALQDNTRGASLAMAGGSSSEK